MMLKAIIFDLDGTLIDSERFYFDCWNQILTEYGPPLTFNDWINNYAGTTIYNNAATLSAKYGISMPLDQLVARREKLTFHRFKTTDVQLMPYALESLDFFRARGLAMAIVTSSLRKDVDAIFERNGLSHYFDLMVTRNDVTNGKPDPEGYNQCCNKLGLLKGNCAVFEDTATGLNAAKSAELVCYAVQSNIDEHPKLRAADKIFLNLKEAAKYLIEIGLVKDTD